MIELTGVAKDFQQGDETIHALRSTDFSAHPGQLVAIIGPSGSGKSTFLTIVGGLQSPTAGRVVLSGMDITDATPAQRSAARFDKLGFILQSSSLVPFLRVEEQLLLHDKVRGRRTDLQRRAELLERLGLTKLARKYPADLSGGERQRVAIATALMHDPDVILADEPTASLDTSRAFETVQLLRELTHDLDKITIMVTHDQRLLRYCDRVYEIRDGELSERPEVAGGEDVGEYDAAQADAAHSHLGK